MVIDSVDALSATLSYANFTLSAASVTTTASNAQFQNAPNVLDIGVQAIGSSIPVTVRFNYYIVDGACPGCIDQIEVGLNTDSAPQACAYNGFPGPSGETGSGTAVINVPNVPGRYYISVDRSQDGGCFASGQIWWTGPPFASRYLAIVNVWTRIPLTATARVN